MKLAMLAEYAKITAKNLRKATDTVSREKHVTRKAKAAKKMWIEKEQKSLVHVAKEKVHMLSIREIHVNRRTEARLAAEKIARHHESVRAKSALEAKMYIRHTVSANKRTLLAKLRLAKIIAPPRKLLLSTLS